jgi:pimeloyl-ACP methyl ester carboxylesterase
MLRYFLGTDLSDTIAVHLSDDIHDVVLAYEQALRTLEIRNAPVVGQSFGGMIPAELAASFPGLFSRVVLSQTAVYTGICTR